MKVINYKGFKYIPVCARVVYGIGFICALIGIVTMLLTIFEIVEVKLCVSLAFVVAGQLLTQPILRKFGNILRKEV